MPSRGLWKRVLMHSGTDLAVPTPCRAQSSAVLAGCKRVNRVAGATACISLMHTATPCTAYKPCQKGRPVDRELHGTNCSTAVSATNPVTRCYCSSSLARQQKKATHINTRQLQLDNCLCCFSTSSCNRASSMLTKITANMQLQASTGDTANVQRQAHVAHAHARSCSSITAGASSRKSTCTQPAAAPAAACDRHSCQALAPSADTRTGQRCNQMPPVST
ncbi:hypothetical protein COO60DRAFT_1529146 [Scenedesmus sp. NREL 46B-D3]|nr:hypothetical protein COO60DRAFT_1529146 [Scenedesmus sp. NREL 46B-D3]